MGIPSPMLKIFNHLPEAVEAFEVFLVELLKMACGIGQGPILLELMKTRIFSAHRYQWVCLLTPPPPTYTHTGLLETLQCTEHYICFSSFLRRIIFQT